MHSRYFRGPMAWVLLLLVAGALLAQTTNQEISGSVTDGSGAGVPNASVTITNENTGVRDPWPPTQMGLM